MVGVGGSLTSSSSRSGTARPFQPESSQRPAKECSLDCPVITFLPRSPPFTSPAYAFGDYPGAAEHQTTLTANSPARRPSIVCFQHLHHCAFQACEAAATSVHPCPASNSAHPAPQQQQHHGAFFQRFYCIRDYIRGFGACAEPRPSRRDRCAQHASNMLAHQTTHASIPHARPCTFQPQQMPLLAAISMRSCVFFDTGACRVVV